jgi:hypothetical protein
MVAAEPDPANKKTLLREIAATEGVNSEQRKRAAAQLQSLEAPGVEVTELPVEEQLPTQPSARRPASAPVAASEAAAGGSRPKAPPKQSKEPAPEATPKTPKEESKALAPSEEDGLIRKSPF